MTKLTESQEKTLRNTAKMHQACLDEVNRMLVEGGCEPHQPGILTGAKDLATGSYARTKSLIGNIVDGVKGGFEKTRKAGQEFQAQRELEKQVDEQLKAVKEQLKAQMP